MSSIVDLLKKLDDHITAKLRVCMPAKIEKYDFRTQKADIKIDMKEQYEDQQVVDYPVISGVPVVFMSAGGASITMPVNRGDACVALFADRDISNWLLGGTGQKANTSRAHSLSDAIVIMGLNTFKTISSAENNTDMLINYSGSKVRIKPNGIVEVETTKDVNITAAETINIQSKNNNITAEENINITAKQDVNVKCIDAYLTASGSAVIKASKTVAITGSELVSVTTDKTIQAVCKNLIVNSSEAVNVTSPYIQATCTENINVSCKNADITASENLVLNGANITLTSTKDITINTGNNITINSEFSYVNVNKDVIINCENAEVNASGQINTKAPKLTHTGNMEIDGTLTLSGSLQAENGISTSGGITNTGGSIFSNGISLEYHTHAYVQAVPGSTPTAVTPGTTSGAI